MVEMYKKLKEVLRRSLRLKSLNGDKSRLRVNRDGWDSYAKDWMVLKEKRCIPDLDPKLCSGVDYLGDEWTLMNASTEHPYGLGIQSLDEFLDYINKRVILPNLPKKQDLVIMEIGPGGGRITKLLLQYCRTIYAVDISSEMLKHLKRRFGGEDRLKYILTDGVDIKGVPDDTLDIVVSFDAFVHIDPWGIYNYLEKVKPKMRRGAIGIVHFSDVETELGFKLFKNTVNSVLTSGESYGGFSVMNKGIMAKFLEELGYEVTSITNDIIPRDAVAIFRKK